MNFQKTFQLPEDWINTTKTYRKACRWIVLDDNKLMPLLFVGEDNYHKLPWWGIKWNEDKIDAFKREVLEETWCIIDSIQEVWTVIEQNSTWEQTSYCYIWTIVSKWIPQFRQWEIEKWYSLKRVTIKEAVILFTTDTPKTRAGKWRQERDLYILQEIALVCE